jgi:uncharacterized protein YxjI
MGEFIPRPDDAPRDSKGAGADVGKILQATALAAQLGKSVEEVLAFMGTSAPSISLPQVAPPMSKAEMPVVVAQEEEVEEGEIEVKPVAKAKAREVPADGFVVTESLDVSEASEADLQKLSEAEQEEENNWDGKIREGSKVKVVYQVNASKINWVGKKGKVIRIVGNEHAKVFEVEFSGRKVAKVRLNKKTGKLERGYENKPLRTTFSEDQLELDA